MPAAVLDRFDMLLINNNRSKAYLQNFLRAGYVPAHVTVLKGSNRRPENSLYDGANYAASSQVLMREDAGLDIRFNEKEHIEATLERCGIPNTVIMTEDVNHPDVTAVVRRRAAPYIIYSGPGGNLLRDPILECGSVILHAHPGWLPAWQGSTTLYYSLLADSGYGCSVIGMEKEIDRGPVYYRCRLEHRRARDIDYFMDPAVRTRAFLDFLGQYWGRTPVALPCEEEDEENVFYIIHPVLKHLAVLSHD